MIPKLTLMVGALFMLIADARSATPTSTNILLVTIDNLGYADLCCCGNPLVQTPNIDLIAREGVRCTAFYSASPTCSPSRAALITGRTPQRNGLNIQLPGIADNWDIGLAPREQLIRPRRARAL